MSDIGGGSGGFGGFGGSANPTSTESNDQAAQAVAEAASMGGNYNVASPPVQYVALMRNSNEPARMQKLVAAMHTTFTMDARPDNQAMWQQIKNKLGPHANNDETKITELWVEGRMSVILQLCSENPPKLLEAGEIIKDFNARVEQACAIKEAERRLTSSLSKFDQSIQLQGAPPPPPSMLLPGANKDFQGPRVSYGVSKDANDVMQGLAILSSGPSSSAPGPNMDSKGKRAATDPDQDQREAKRAKDARAQVIKDISQRISRKPISWFIVEPQLALISQTQKFLDDHIPTLNIPTGAEREWEEILENMHKALRAAANSITLNFGANDKDSFEIATARAQKGHSILSAGLDSNGCSWLLSKEDIELIEKLQKETTKPGKPTTSTPNVTCARCGRNHAEFRANGDLGCYASEPLPGHTPRLGSKPFPNRSPPRTRQSNRSPSPRPRQDDRYDRERRSTHRFRRG